MKNKLTVLPPSDKALATPLQSDFDHARKIQKAAKMNMIQAAGFMVLFGLELKRLKKIQPETRGKKGKNPTQIGFLTWEEKVKAELGITDDTARKYIEMAEEAKKRVSILAQMEEVLLTTSLMSLPDAQQAQIMGAVQKLTDGNTAKSLMQEWGIARQDPSANLKKDRNKGGKSTKSKTTPEEDAQEKFHPLFMMLAGHRLDNLKAFTDAIYHLPLEREEGKELKDQVCLVEFLDEIDAWQEALATAKTKMVKALHGSRAKDDNQRLKDAKRSVFAIDPEDPENK